jgi:hypothetical protein
MMGSEWILGIRTGWGVELIQLAQYRDRWRAVVNTVMNQWDSGAKELVISRNDVVYIVFLSLMSDINIRQKNSVFGKTRSSYEENKC